MRILFIFLALTFSAFTFAYPIEKSIGFGLGYTWTESVFNDQVIYYNDASETPSYTDVTNSSQPFSFYSNFRFHKYYGVELGYMNYGKINFDKSLIKTQNNPAPNTSGLIESRVRDAAISISGFYLSHVLYMPISDAIQLQAKAGVIIGNSEYSDLGTLTIEAQGPDTSQQIIPSVNASSEAFAKAHLAAAIRYLSSTNTAWRLQLSQIEISHDGEQETFTQWFTQLSYEIKL